MSPKERILRPIQGGEVDRIPTLGGWIGGVSVISNLAGISEAGCLENPLRAVVRAHHALGIAGMVHPVVHHSASQVRAGYMLEEQSLDEEPEALQKAAAIPDSEVEILASFERAAAEADARMSHLRRGWYWGRRGFAERLEGLVKAVGFSQRSRGYRGAAARRSHGMSLAEALLGEGLHRAGFSARELAETPGSDWRNVALARLISEQTTVGHQWLAERLAMRSAANVSQLLRQKSAREEAKRLPPGLGRWIDKKRSALAQRS